MTVVLLSKAAYARHRKCDEKAVRKAIAEGRISTIGGKIDPAVADIQWAANTRARAGSGSKAAAPAAAATVPSPAAPEAPQQPVVAPEPGYADFRARRERADAERSEMETARMAGRLVDRDLIERTVFDAFRQLRDAVIASAPRASAKVLGIADARDIEIVFVGELRHAFKGWEERMLDRLPARDGIAK